jgi:hypothetical protein
MTQRLSPLTHGGPVRRPDDFDELLTRFFRAEMPDPWPAAPRVPPAQSRRQAPARPWFRHSSRLALAAAVALFLIGYLTLAAKFPNTSSRKSTIDPTHPTATDPLRPHQLPSKMQNPVDPSRLQGNMNLQLLRPEIAPIPNGRRAESSGYIKGREVIINVRQLP